jgi:hypothetical protein
MFCPRCAHPNRADADTCVKCQQDTGYFGERVFIGRQFIFVQADERHPVALQVDDTVHTYYSSTILSRHQHAISFGDKPIKDKEARTLMPELVLDPTARKELQSAWPLPDQPQLPHPSLELLTVVTDRKIYQPDAEATLFIVAPDAGESAAALEIQFAGQKVYEAQVLLNRDGLALHHYSDLKEGEYTAIVTLPDRHALAGGSDGRAECTFSVAEYTLSPLIASLENHKYAHGHLTFTLKLLLLSMPYSGPVEFGLGCQVCRGRVVATQQTEATHGVAEGDFDVARHGGPFRVQVTTPDGNTALVAFPGTGAVEREHIAVNPLGQTYDMGLLPWENAQPVRGFYIGPGQVNMTPLMLESVHAARGRLQAAANISEAQILTFSPRRPVGDSRGASQALELADVKRGQEIEFNVEAPYTLFTVGAFTQDEPFEGWGVVIRPLAFEATLTVPQTAQPGEAIDVYIASTWADETPQPVSSPSLPRALAPPLFCWLLVYDARLEHESPMPKLAKRIYESVRDASGNLAAGPVPNAHDQRWALPGDVVRGLGIPARFAAVRAMAPSAVLAAAPMALEAEASAAMPLGADTAVEAPVMVVTPARMEFPELVYSELFYMEGQASRTVKLGDQIGTWRVRAYVFQGADYHELTADVQADKPLYAELDLPAIASPGDEITAAVNYHTRERADLVVATPFGETWTQVTGNGTERFAIYGPGRVEARIVNQAGSDWTVREVAPPGIQKVTASRLVILDRGQTVQGEKVVVYASMGQVLKDTITALIGYPFG